jgi:hypothetical protein
VVPQRYASISLFLGLANYSSADGQAYLTNINAQYPTQHPALNDVALQEPTLSASDAIIDIPTHYAFSTDIVDQQMLAS